MALKFKKNDQVIVVSGSNKGKTGNILSVQDERVVIAGVNLATIHKKPTSNQSGEITKKEMSIHISNISHIENGKPVKIAFRVEEGKGKNFTKKIRVSKKTGKKID
ncbi:MAG: rplX [Rickettsiaceae bacterium]|jgi:large subunit ribosomal protein L24|nr:rplX [Rickettsiaceae bacterium]